MFSDSSQSFGHRVWFRKHILKHRHTLHEAEAHTPASVSLHFMKRFSTKVHSKHQGPSSFFCREAEVLFGTLKTKSCLSVASSFCLVEKSTGVGKKMQTANFLFVSFFFCSGKRKMKKCTNKQYFIKYTLQNRPIFIKWTLLNNKRGARKTPTPLFNH